MTTEKENSFKSDPHHLRFQCMIGVGGIGVGKFFALNGNHTLGREESRNGHFLDQRDYCKLHIISHYVQTILGSPFTTIPVGKVGDDEWGHTLLEEMQTVGCDRHYIDVVPGAQTMFSLCFIYPDGTGGNLTVDDSACSRVDHAFVEQVEPEFARYAGKGVALAAPEVLLSARMRLLELATQSGFFRVACVTTAEANSREVFELVALTDLLSINLDEAAGLTGKSFENSSPEIVIEAAIDKLRQIKQNICVAITAGKKGSWVWDTKVLVHHPAMEVVVVGTAGAGDAFLAGMISGLSAGLSLAEAHELAGLVAGLSVTSPHTIHPGINRKSLKELAMNSKTRLSQPVISFLGKDIFEFTQ